MDKWDSKEFQTNFFGTLRKKGKIIPCLQNKKKMNRLMSDAKTEPTVELSEIQLIHLGHPIG